MQGINRKSTVPWICDTTYPYPRQVGQGHFTGTGVTDTTTSYPEGPGVGYLGDSEPFYVWNNIGTAVTGSCGNGLGPGVDTYSDDTCGKGQVGSTF